MTTKKTDITDLLSPEVVERRTAIARMRQMELSVQKDELALEEKKRNICRIDVALSEFDSFLADFAEMLIQMPDKLQTMIPAMDPKTYVEIQHFFDDQIQRLGKKRLDLAIDSTDEERARATDVKNESIQKNAKIKKGKK